MFRPGRNAHYLSIEREKAICASIAVLLCHCCPTAIRWFVISVIVDSVNRVPGTWPFAHVSEEHSKVVLPALTDMNPTAAVSFVLVVGWVVTAVEHVAVNAVFERSERCAVVDSRGATATLTRLSRPKPVHCDKAFVSAPASAEPVVSPVLTMVKPKYGPRSEHFAGSVLDSSARKSRIVGSHGVALLTRVALWIEPARRSNASLARFIVPLVAVT